MATTNTKKQNTIVIDDGTREYPIVNKYGEELCRLRVRASDWSILDRYKDFMADFDKVTAPLKEIGVNGDGTAQFDDDWKKLKSVEAELIKRINALLDTDNAEQIFAKRNAFSIIGGRFFCEIVLDALGGVIIDAINEEKAASNQRMNKYLSADAKAKA